MERKECKYDEMLDIQAVDTVGWIDLAEAVRNGYVPGSIDADDMVYNDIEDPESIMHTASDVFELYRQADYIKGFASESETKEHTE